MGSLILSVVLLKRLFLGHKIAGILYYRGTTRGHGIRDDPLAVDGKKVLIKCLARVDLASVDDEEASHSLAINLRGARSK